VTRLVDHDWVRELDAALRADASELRIICPFIKAPVIRRLLASAPARVRVITRFDLNDFAQGVSDIAALEGLLQAGAQIRGVIGLHAKSYGFGDALAFVTSANLTHAALNTNHEFGLVSGDASVVSACKSYFEALWSEAGCDLTTAEVAAWRIAVADRRAAARPSLPPLPDFGADVGLPRTSTAAEAFVRHEATQGFLKFLGRSGDRQPATLLAETEVERSGCHWVLTIPRRSGPEACVRAP
jgi:phospholipase D-like protein